MLASTHDSIPMSVSRSSSRKRPNERGGSRGRQEPGLRERRRHSLSDQVFLDAPGKEVVLAGRQRFGPGWRTNPTACPALLDHSTPREMANSPESWGHQSILKPLVCRRRRAISRRKSGRRPRTTSARRKRRETVSCAVSLDGTLIFPDGEAHWREASYGTVNSQDMKVNHLKRPSQMPARRR